MTELEQTVNSYPRKGSKHSQVMTEQVHFTLLENMLACLAHHRHTH